MKILPPRAVRGLGLCLAAGAALAAAPLAPQTLRALKARQPERAATALVQARQRLPELGFRPGASLSIRNAVTTPEGRTVVRYDQTWQGIRVWGAGGIGHVEADGSARLLASGLLADAAPAGSPVLTQEQAEKAALGQLRLKGQPMAPRTSLVVFPTALTGGLRVKWDAQAGRFVTDRDWSILSRPGADPYVWAYEVNVGTWNAADGITDALLVVDARTGAILRKDDNLRRQAAPAPAKGTGRGQYCGPVSLDTAKAEDGTYTLRDLGRGSQPNPYFQMYEGKDLTGMFTMWEAHDGGDPGNYEVWGLNRFYEGNATNEWGDGLGFQGHPHEGDANGQTAAVDAQFGLAQTWDLLKNVFGRDGIDGKGTTPFAQVHIREQGTGLPFDNAFWSHWIYGMFFGDGTYFEDRALRNADGTVRVIPGNPGGCMSLTEVDVTAHELAHGLTWETAAFSYGGESGGLNEGASDIMGQLVEAYAGRPAGADATIPEGGDWLVGSKVRPAGALRSMIRPSSDGLSADNWYEGLDWLDVHYNSGPLNRWFYYLSQGAPASASHPGHSAYLPGGMQGIGMDKAGRIWFKALTEHLGAQDTYHTAAAGVVTAATELYGAGSAEVTAVKRAFTAVNVQVEGEPLLTRVTFPVIREGGFLGRNPGSLMSRTTIVPLGVSLRPVAQVLNNADTRVAWKAGGSPAAVNNPLGTDPSAYGRINADGTWTAPYKLGWFILTASSVAEPGQYAQGFALTVNLDTDDDAEQDAVDMGSTAISYWMPYSLKPSHSPYGGPWVEDMDADFFQTAIRTAWGLPQSQK
ncbi:MAG TPA: M4 family metallopeptidase [Holophaga sp.]|nr:M4 family metallopeptidase [Holophaga sp.]